MLTACYLLPAHVATCPVVQSILNLTPPSLSNGINNTIKVGIGHGRSGQQPVALPLDAGLA